MGSKFIDVENVLREKNPGLARWVPGFLLRYLKNIVHEEEINQIIHETQHLQGYDFCKEVLKRFNITVTTRQTNNIPVSGGTIFACNHPLGGLDALALVQEVHAIRTDIKFVVNDILLHLKSLSEMFVGVNKHGTNTKKSLAELNQVFASDDAVFVFPAGLVSRKQQGLVRDLPWQKTFVSRAKKYEHNVIPVFIEGRLSNKFYRLANFRKLSGIKANLEMLYLADELFKLKNTRVTLTFGEPIPFSTFDRSKSDDQWAQWVKERVYQLQS